jgi:tetratricopeptide (TPR) repeat protein
LALDPDDIESLFWTGTLLIDYGDLNKAKTWLTRVLTLADNGDQAVYKYGARVGLGDIQQRSGDLPGALQNYTQEKALIEGLAQAHPDNLHWQRELTVLHNRTGDVQKAQGDLVTALDSYRAGRAIARHLAELDPGNLELQRDLEVSNFNIGNVLVKQGKLGEAEASFRAGLVIAERLAALDPGNGELQRDLSASYGTVGDIMVQQHFLAGAIMSYSAGLVIAEGLAKTDANNMGWQFDLAMDYGKLADANRLFGDSAKVPELLQRSREIMIRLTKLAPDSAEWKKVLTMVELEIAQLPQNFNQTAGNGLGSGFTPKLRGCRRKTGPFLDGLANPRT